MSRSLCTHSRALLGAALLLTPSLSGQSFVREDGAPPRAGLGKEFHASRRAALRQALGEGLVVLRGLPETRAYERFQQARNFWWLTGVNAPDAALILDAASGREILLLHRAERAKEGWEGELWDTEDDWVRERTGIQEIRPLGELWKILQELSEPGQRVWTQLTPWVAMSGAQDRAGPYVRHQRSDPADGRESREQRFRKLLEEKLEVKVRGMAKHVHALRLRKTERELEAMRAAGRIGALAMREAMRATRPGLGEWQIEAVMSFVQRAHGCDGPAYVPIIGSGPNSLVLHYSHSQRRMQDGDVLLIDFAPTFDFYTSDITRTWPVNGRFSARQAELYDAVLEAQLAGIAAVRPGRTMMDVDRACRRVLKKRGLGSLVRHGSCHWIGMEVHDPGPYMTRFEPGMAFTIEPGVYEAETGIGIRIEDVVVVTEDGCEVLTKDVPKTRDEIEGLVGTSRLLQEIGAAAAGKKPR
jgi:Xaa-Pro aminopeptidase